MVAINHTNAFQSLERRLLMATTPVTLGYLNGVLSVTGTTANDAITVTQSGNVFTVVDNGWSTKATYAGVTQLVVNGADGTDKLTANVSVATSLVGGNGNDTLVGGGEVDILIGSDGNDSLVGSGGADKLYGGGGNDTLSGGDGNDQLFGGVGIDALFGNNGDDTLISLGGGVSSTLTGGDGTDTFWLDANATETVKDASSVEISIGAQHRVDGFQNERGSSIVKDLLGTVSNVVTSIVDPVMNIANATFRNFRNDPLFATTGPSADDVKQGQVGDCYFLSQLASYAKVDPTLIKQSIVDLGDGTYAVQFKTNGVAKFYRVDADLPSYSASATAGAGLGVQSSLWVALMEKAWTFARKGAGSYASIEAGWMSEVASAFGKTSTYVDVSAGANGTALLQQIQQALAAGKSVTVGTNTSQASGSTMVGSHAYTVVSVQADGKGGLTLTVRNPWGIDGYTTADGKNDGLVTLTSAQFTADIDAVNIATA